MRERITIEDAQPLIGLPIRTVQAMAAKGEIPGAAKMRRRWTFDRVKLEGWIVHKEQETWQNAQSRRPVVIGGGPPSGPPRWSTGEGAGGRLTQVIQRLQKNDAKRAKLASSPTPTTATPKDRLKRRPSRGRPISPVKSTTASSGGKLKLVTSVSIGQLAPYLEGRTLTDIDMRFLGGMVEGREKVVTNATIKRDLVALSSLMNFALDKGWVEQNPVLIKLPRVKEGKHPIEPPRREDIDLALSRAPGMLGPLARLAMATGARLDELVTLKRDQIDHDRQQLVIVGKGAKRRVVDLRVMNAYALIAALPAYVGSPYVFWHDKGEPYRNASSNFANNVVNAMRDAGERRGRRVSPVPLPRSAPLARDRISQGGLGDDLRSQAAARPRKPDHD